MNASNQKNNEDLVDITSFNVVAIAASAGGLNAI
jgi:chemotaxis response regulator CheB